MKRPFAAALSFDAHLHDKLPERTTAHSQTSSPALAQMQLWQRAVRQQVLCLQHSPSHQRGRNAVENEGPSPTNQHSAPSLAVAAHHWGKGVVAARALTTLERHIVASHMVHCCKVERVEFICSSSASVSVPPPKVRCCSLRRTQACVGRQGLPGLAKLRKKVHTARGALTWSGRRALPEETEECK